MKRLRTCHGRWTAALLAVAVMLAAAASAAAYSAQGGAAANDFATGFPTQGGIGPIGVGFDPLGRLYVAGRSHLYRFGPRGGRADASSQVDHWAVAPPLGGLAFGTDGRLYVTAFTSPQQGEVDELDTANGNVLQTVASGIPCPTGLAADPVTGDLFVSEADCGTAILRINGPASGAPVVTTFASGIHADGLTFGPDGTLYAAHASSPAPNGDNVSAFDRSGHRTDLAFVPHADGVAVASAPAGQAPPFLIVNRNDGVVTRVDLTGSGAHTDLLTGGSRGDFVTVGPDRCLYATQTSSIVKITDAGGSCSSGTGPLGAGLAPTSANSRVRCRAPSITVPLRFRGRKLRRLRFARVYIGRRLVRTVRRRRALRGSVILRNPPRTAFMVWVRATPRRGRTYVSYVRRYPPCGRHLRDKFVRKSHVHGPRHRHVRRRPKPRTRPHR